MTSVTDLPYEALEAMLQGDGVSPTHAAVLWKSLYQQFDSLSDREAPLEWPPPLRHWWHQQLAAGSFPGNNLEMAREIRSADGLTRKYLLRLEDGHCIETVLMAYDGRFTVCLSTQVGCAMGCVFCATGQAGFTRQLRPGEIVAQVLHCQRVLKAEGLERRPDRAGGVRNLVLMGMGEPLHNYDHVMTALRLITDTRGLNIGPSKITISTVGVVPGILRLADEPEPFNLAVSLHGATQAERQALVPVAKRWDLLALMEACHHYGQTTGRRIFFEWTLIAGANDSPAQAQSIVQLLQGLDAHVNLIPLNPTAGFGGTASDSPAVQRFKNIIKEAGFPCTVRQRRGIDVAAGCGMLAGEG